MDKNGKKKYPEGVPYNKRDAIRAFLESGKTYREIADILGVSKSTVGNVAKEAQAVDGELVAAIKKTEVDTLKAKCNMLLDGLTPDKVEKARLTEISIAYGTLFDKRQLLTGGATQNIGISAIIKAAHGLNGNIGGNTAKGTTD